ncbi:PilZ domain-containing protein [Dongia sedimenti]|uniref:PilZ domain-containing protein n=1 Tax=Dongia sedimenti TaxID=3064282 RepID=A0ABU0YPP7_9PROT|nr:PilZ domain-containing protein [Rhodospirillaceae bacterium R-7]
MSEYGKRSAPVVAKTLSPEALARWRSRARNILNPTPPAMDEAGSPAGSPATAPQSADPSDGVADAAQRRHALRQRTLIGAQVVFNDLMSTYNCTVRDLSDTGARIKLNAPVQVPPAFMLRFSDGRVRQCKVRRRNALELGIEFLD